jgi:hypothetical protein
MPKLHNMARVEEAATFIAGELRTILDRKDIDSHMSRRVREACPAYNGLTNGEVLLATLRALSMAQLEISAELADLTDGKDDDGNTLGYVGRVGEVLPLRKPHATI